MHRTPLNGAVFYAKYDKYVHHDPSIAKQWLIDVIKPQGAMYDFVPGQVPYFFALPSQIFCNVMELISEAR